MLGCLGFSYSAVSITYAGHLTPKGPPHDGHSDSPFLAWLLHQPSLFSSWWDSWDKKMMLGLWVLCLLEQSLPSCHYAFLLASHPCAPTQISPSSALHPGHPAPRLSLRALLLVSGLPFILVKRLCSHHKFPTASSSQLVCGCNYSPTDTGQSTCFSHKRSFCCRLVTKWRVILLQHHGL